MAARDDAGTRGPLAEAPAGGTRRAGRVGADSGRASRGLWRGWSASTISVVSLVSVAIVGTMGTVPASPASAVAAYPTSHTLTLSFLEDPGQPPDPDVYYAGEGLLLTRNIYQGLVQYAPGTANRKIIPDLATSWTISPNGLTYTFHLRHGVLFHDGTPFTSAAVPASFARRLAVNGGPAYQVQGATVTTPDPYTAVIALPQPNTAFLDFMASAYGPAMESPTGLAKYAGSDNDQTYMATHDLGTGPYTLSEAKVGVAYQLKAFPQYWGKKPYYTTVDIPVIDNISTAEIEFNDAQINGILHDVPTAAIQQYRSNPKAKVWNLPILESDTAYLNPNKGILTQKKYRLAVIEAINAHNIVAGVFPGGRAVVATQASPAHLLPKGVGMQTYRYRPSVLQGLVKHLSGSQKNFVVGYDTGAPDDQLIAEDVGAELTSAGLNVKVVGEQTSSIYGWVGSTQAAIQNGPNLLIDYFWPDADNAYTWTHISFDPTGGLQYETCNVPGIATIDQSAVTTGKWATYNKVVGMAENADCWFNIADKDDTMVLAPWLKGVAHAHNVATAQTLFLNYLYPG